MLLSKEATTKDVQLKSQMMMSFQDEDTTKGVSEFIWPKFGYFGEHNIDLTIPKANFPELTFCYSNQARVSLVKSGEKAIYCDYVIIAQIMPLITIDPSIDLNSYVPNEHQTIIYVPLYNKGSGLFYGLARRLGHITVRGDEEERFFSYGYSKEKSKILFSNMKTQLPNMFSATCFKKHTQYLLDQNKNHEKFSKLYYFLPATLDRKEEIIQWKDNVHLHPIDFSEDDMKRDMGINVFEPSVLENQDEAASELRSRIRMLMKKVAMLSNQNLVRNAKSYLAQGYKTDPEVSLD